MNRFLVVSVHDIAPSTADDVRWALAALDGLGVERRVLKVVPRWGGRDALLDDPALVALLREEMQRGSEIVLHGLTHRTSGPFRGPRVQRARARLFAPDDAEFLALDTEASAAALEHGLADIAEVGLSTAGFCPPAWIASPELDAVLERMGFAYNLGFAGITDLRRDRYVNAPAIGYMGADPVQEQLIGIQRRFVLGWRPRPRVLRVFLHPPGIRSSPAADAVLRSLPDLLRTRRVATYSEVLDA